MCLLYNICYRKGFARSSNSQQGLCPHAICNSLTELFDGLGLIAHRHEGRNNLELWHLTKLQGLQDGCSQLDKSSVEKINNVIFKNTGNNFCFVFKFTQIR